MRRGRWAALTALALLPAPAAGQSDGDPLRRATAGTAAGPIVIDGRLDEPAWGAVPALAGFRQHEPLEGAPVSERTEVRILYDRDALYVGAWLFDGDAAGIVAGESRRDVSLEDSDAFVIVLDTYRDAQNAFVFATTPAGVAYDGQVTREGEGGGQGRRRQQAGSGAGFNINWDGAWEVATAGDDAGWYAEFRIPFSTLRYAGPGPQRWGLNLARHIRRRNEQAFWSPVPRQHSLYRLSEAGLLEGLEAPAQWRATVTPYVLASTQREYDAPPPAGARGCAGTGDATVSQWTMGWECGVDVKLVPTPSLTLDLTYNTDFAQVEVDEQQVNLTRFNLFFPEKRPFFLENAGLFAVGTPQAVEMFFSRRIGISDTGALVPIVGGGRVSGKIGSVSVGLLDIQTGRVAGVVEPTNYAVARVARELGRSRLGAIVVNRVATTNTADYNRTYAVDGRLGVGAAWTVDAYGALTETPGRTGRDHAVSIGGAYTTREWQARATFAEVGEDFNPEAGFLERAGYRYVQAFVLHHVRTPGIPWLREFRPHVSYRGYFDFQGFNETRDIHFDSHVELANGAFFSPAFNLTREGLKSPFEIADSVVVPPGTYDNVEAAWRFNTNESAPVSVNGSLDVGGFYSGRRKGVSGALTLRQGAVAAALRLDYNDVDLAEGSFETALVGLRIAYAFTPSIYLQSLVQYNSQADAWSGNVRFGWLGSAGTGLFVVYNDVEYATALFSDWEPVSRAVIVKFSKRLSWEW